MAHAKVGTAIIGGVGTHSPSGAYEDVGPRPNPKLTPGSVRAVSTREVCERTDFDLDPKLAAENVRSVYRAYGINVHAAASYQVEYLINPQLGGDDEMANLWPESSESTLWNATAKDDLERHLQRMVCGGNIGFSEAQHDLASDWIAAYRKYLQTERPVRTVTLEDIPNPVDR